VQPPLLPRCYDSLVHRLFSYDHIAAHPSARRIKQVCLGARTLLDLAGGTGNLTLPLARLGYDVTGVDRSADMLAVAREKAAQTGVTCFYGGLNYLDSLGAVRDAFETAHAAIVPGGLLLFDQLSNAVMHYAGRNMQYDLRRPNKTRNPYHPRKEQSK
jgi:2-polyprenyl-3-methyl-5-hydroxy-6-metoxy-1,4-benzoquinol methylase